MTGTRTAVLVLVGPTASGKTDISIPLAMRLGAEIISADSRQIYKLLDVGTAKPTEAQLSAVRHHFISERFPDEPYTAGEFGIDGRRIIAGILEGGKSPLVVGGSGLYVQSLIDGLFEGPSSDPEIREILSDRAARGEIPALWEELRRVDPESAARADQSKPRRIIRALEVFYVTGRPLSVHHRESKPVIGFEPVQIGIEWKREDLYRRIEARCDMILEGGLEAEVRNLAARGYDRTLNALNTVGYAEMFAYLNGEVSRPEMERLFKQNTRRYAKRQMTWFRRDTRIKWVEMNGSRTPDAMAEEILAVSRKPLN